MQRRSTCVGFHCKLTSYMIEGSNTGPAATKNLPISYPIITVRWLAVHALAIPTVFFFGALTAMQFIQR